ncbi:putative ATPase/DNA-binding SARP family transcriptional activator [Catenuloplanes nepalensis]|uniref:ATPase/DNA-binding SARP family transcriptional activator n=1 Tax=Catenuloplanes nepalensis TaxID=587533 RepID=A0ABT9MLD5_9ACTN|nr:BTAD domain-containing putative transcriptional regulator [Catenuloplanes nepalensis]MDP9792237.1 putative ATPase/DNA-binding SARP family transcriptional activator [Catenuloplanes nepalensis]
MRVGILGPLEVAADGVAVEVAGGRLRALLIRLALEPGRAVSVATLADALWAEEAPGDPVGAIQQLVSRLRRALPDGAVLRSTPAGYVLELPADAVDAVRFERLVAEGRQALRAGRPAEAGAVLCDALRLWRGAALADAADAPYAQGAAARLEELRLAAAEDRAEAELAAAGDAGVPAELIAELGELEAAHPLRERIHALRMRALIADGRVAEALTVYAELRERLAGTLGVDPSPEVQAVHLAALRHRPGPAAAPMAGTNLRAPITSFVGREAERTLLIKQLTEGRLVTLVGPGGAGKTRLATTVAHEIHEGPRDTAAGGVPRGGVWLVELAPVAADGDVAQAALGALQKLRVTSFGAARAPGGTIDRLVELLAPHDAVLVLDNCEHVIAGAARLADELLGSCPRLRIIATSRERLGIAGEALCPVPPLDLPAPHAGAAEALGWASVRLFRDRAVAVRPDFAVDAATVGAVVEVCRRLDGMPLAIELAAARLRALPIQEVVRRLDDRFALLTGGSRTALPRHRTLRAVVSWSWDLLDDAEALLAARLAVFPGAFTLADAETVCDVPGDVLLSLVDRSLVQTASAAEPRYRMLDTIAAYAAERLDASGGTHATRAAHARHFLALAEEAEPHLRRAEQLEWLAKLDGAHDDLIAALRFAAETHDSDLAVRMTAALGMYWIITGKQDEALEWCEIAGALPGPAPAAARVIVLVGRLMPRFTEVDQAAGPAEIRALLDGLGDADRGHPFLALIEAGLPIYAEDMPAALAVIDRHLAGPDPWLRAMMHLIRSHVRENDGDPAGRRHELETASGIFRDLGERMGLAGSLTELSEALSLAGEFDAALAVLDESISLLRTLNVTDDVAHQRIWRALIAARTGGPEHARAEFEAVLTECDLSGSLRAQSFANVTFGAAFAALGDLDRAEARLLRSRELMAAARTAPPQIDVLIGCGLAVIAAQRGDAEPAAAMIPGLVAAARRIADVPVLARAGVTLAFVRRAQGRPAEAAELLGAAETIRGGPDRLSLDIAMLTDGLTAELGAAAFAEAVARGLALSREAAVALLP